MVSGIKPGSLSCKARNLTPVLISQDPQFKKCVYLTYINLFNVLSSTDKVLLLDHTQMKQNK